jgi:uncharacterized membrane protein YphA (DoxX/SURF4 family)
LTLSALAVVASVVLGVAFLVAGGSKIAAGPSWPTQARGLGAPIAVIPVVPWFELALGAVLVVQVARVPAALVALVVLVVFTALIARRLAQGEHPSCACFGAWSARPLGPGHLVRNVALMALAVVAAVG